MIDYFFYKKQKKDKLKHLSSLSEKSTEILLVMVSERNLDLNKKARGKNFVEGMNPVY